MSRGDSEGGWLFWLAARPGILVASLLVVAVGVFSLIAVYLDRRFDGLHNMRYQPPVVQQGVQDVARLQDAVTGGTVYVPAYSHVYARGGQPYLLETILSIRNTDSTGSLALTSVRYYDTAGALVRRFLEDRVELGPLATIEFLVEQQDTTGGSGANFMVEWVAQEEINRPLIEAVMIGAESGRHSLSFASRGVSVTTR